MTIGTTSLGSFFVRRFTRQFEGFVYVDGQLGRENQDVIRVPSLRKIGKCF